MSLVGYACVKASADEKDVLFVAVVCGKLGNLIFGSENSLNFLRQRFELCDYLFVFYICDCAAYLSHINGYQVHANELCSVRFG